MSKTTANADEQELVTISLDNDCIRVHPAAQSKSQRTTALQLPYGPLARRMLECLDLGLIPPVLAPALGVSRASGWVDGVMHVVLKAPPGPIAGSSRTERAEPLRAVLQLRPTSCSLSADIARIAEQVSLSPSSPPA